jgi:hypothetical protein
MSGRPRALDDEQESLLYAVVEVGLPVRRAALAFEVSAKTAGRVVARRRRAEREPTLDELIALVLKDDPATTPARQRLPDWRTSAALLEQLESEDWGDWGMSE